MIDMFSKVLSTPLQPKQFLDLACVAGLLGSFHSRGRSENGAWPISMSLRAHALHALLPFLYKVTATLKTFANRT